MEYEFEKVGYTNSQYLRGVSVRNASFPAEEAFYGVGSTPYAAFDDGLEQMGMRGYDVAGVDNPFEHSDPSDAPEEVQEAWERNADVSYYIAFWVRGGDTEEGSPQISHSLHDDETGEKYEFDVEFDEMSIFIKRDGEDLLAFEVFDGEVNVFTWDDNGEAVKLASWGDIVG